LQQAISTPAADMANHLRVNEFSFSSGLPFQLWLSVVGTAIRLMRTPIMKHIPTTVTALRKIKAEAKRMREAQGISLARAQDAAARDAGYEHFHHVTACLAKTETPMPLRFAGLSQLVFHIEEDPGYDEANADAVEVRATRQIGRFAARNDSGSLESSALALNATLDHLDTVFDDVGEMPPADLEMIIARCRDLTAAEPAFLDGYAHWASALVALNRGAECVGMARPVYDAACAMVPGTFNGLIPYWDLENRPFHRLAHNLLLAHKQAGQFAEAKAIAQRMLQWWPNDNIGFRFLLNDRS
jgi:hypothetical protein